MQFDIYGMGNALVDMTYHVSDEFLNKHEVAKGLMSLVDEQRQAYLMEELGQFEPQMACGGSAANTIIAAQQFGSKNFYSCLVADDFLGDFYYQDLTKNAVQSDLATCRGQGQTGKCLVMVTSDAERTMNTYLGITAQYSSKQLNLEALKNSKWLYIEGYLVTGEQSFKACLEAQHLAKKYGLKVALTFSDPSIVEFFHDQMSQLVEAGVDLLFCNEAEAQKFTKVVHWEEQLIERVESFAVTLGAQGCRYYLLGEAVNIAGHKVEAVDSNGAGDMFAGAFLNQIVQGKSYREASEFAVRASSRIVSQYGPRLGEKAICELKDYL